jgi:hypothetical protein
VGLVALAGMLAFGILGRDFGTLKHLQALNDTGALHVVLSRVPYLYAAPRYLVITYLTPRACYELH